MLSSVGVPREFHLRKRRPRNAAVVYSYPAFHASSRELYLITKSPGHFRIVVLAYRIMIYLNFWGREGRPEIVRARCADDFDKWRIISYTCMGSRRKNDRGLQRKIKWNETIKGDLKKKSAARIKIYAVIIRIVMPYMIWFCQRSTGMNIRIHFRSFKIRFNSASLSVDGVKIRYFLFFVGKKTRIFHSSLTLPAETMRGDVTEL